ncbi:MAG: AraC family transcriptional regulator [Succinatimonas hippei]|nr:AraC family transcriptional regulator [Succinatimonas hippei]
MRQKTAAYHENRSRGTLEFPFDYHYIDREHPRFVMPYHYHSALEISKVLRGGLDISLNERHYSLNEGDCIIIQGNVVHGGRPRDNDTVYRCVVFSVDMLLDVEKPPFSFLRRLAKGQIMINECYRLSQAKGVCDCVERLLSEVDPENGATTRQPMNAIAAVLSIFAEIERSGAYRVTAETMPKRYLSHLDKVSILFRYIHDNYQKQITLDDMAKVAGMSPKYFCRFFHELTGKRPIEYLNAFRVESAAGMLLSGDKSVGEIAVNCGFNDPCYFAKLFKRYRGQSPSEFCLSPSSREAIADLP